ncbi:MAG: DUF2807 domain-containing protein [Bacteroidota bacterium]
MMRHCSSLLILAFVSLFFACDKDKIIGSGIVISEERAIDTFKQVIITGIANVYLEYDENTSLVVEADDNLIGEISTISDGRNLRIATDFERTEKVTMNVYVKNPNLLFLLHEGTGRAEIKDFELEQLRISNEENGYIEVSAKVDTLFIRNEKSGTFKGFDCQTNIGVVNQSGVGDLEVNVADRLIGTILSEGNVFYKGNPEIAVRRESTGEVIDAN